MGESSPAPVVPWEDDVGSDVVFGVRKDSASLRRQAGRDLTGLTPCPFGVPLGAGHADECSDHVGRPSGTRTRMLRSRWQRPRCRSDWNALWAFREASRPLQNTASSESVTSVPRASRPLGDDARGDHDHAQGDRWPSHALT